MESFDLPLSLSRALGASLKHPRTSPGSREGREGAEGRNVWDQRQHPWSLLQQKWVRLGVPTAAREGPLSTGNALPLTWDNSNGNAALPRLFLVLQNLWHCVSAFLVLSAHGMTQSLGGNCLGESIWSVPGEAAPPGISEG